MAWQDPMWARMEWEVLPYCPLELCRFTINYTVVRMHMQLTSSLISVILVAVTAFLADNLHAQALDPPSPPLHLGSSPFKWDRMPSIAVNTAGEALIYANDLRIWTDDSPARITKQLPPDSVLMVLALAGERWYGIYERDVPHSSSVAGWETAFHLCSGIGSIQDHASGKLHSDMMLEEKIIPGAVSFASTMQIAGWMNEGSLVLLRDQYRYDDMTIMSAGVDASLVHWTPGDSIATLYALDGSFGAGYWADSTAALLGVSRPAANSCIIYKREDLESERPGDVKNARHYVRSFSVVDLRSMTMTPFRTIDTLHKEELEHSDVVLPPRGTNFDVLRMDRRTGQLFAERLNMEGNASGRHYLTGPLHEENRVSMPMTGPIPELSMASFAAWPIDGDRTLLAWSEQVNGNRADLFIAMFDSSWNPVGSIRTVDEGEGVRYFPVLVAQGDRAYIAWYNYTAHGETHSWLRVYGLDYLMTEKMPPTAAEFEVEGPWPQPVREMLNFSVNVKQPAHKFRYTVFDILGRCVRSGSIDPQLSSNVALDLRGVASGSYTLYITSRSAGKAMRFTVAN